MVIGGVESSLSLLPSGDGVGSILAASAPVVGSCSSSSLESESSSWKTVSSVIRIIGLSVALWVPVFLLVGVPLPGGLSVALRADGSFFGEMVEKGLGTGCAPSDCLSNCNA